LLNPSGGVVVVRDVVLGDVARMHTFGLQDPEGEYRLRVSGVLRNLRLSYVAPRWDDQVEVAFDMLGENISARVLPQPDRLALFPTRGTPNALAPNGRLTSEFLIALGLPATTVALVSVTLSYPDPLLLDFPGALDPDLLVVNTTVLGGWMTRSTGTGALEDLPLPPLHQPGANGVVPLRYGPAELQLFDPPTRSLIGASRVYILPPGFSPTDSFSERASWPAVDVARQPLRPLVTVVGEGTEARLVTTTVMLPTARVVAEDVRHGGLVEDYELQVENLDVIAIGQERIALFEQSAQGAPTSAPIQAPLRPLDYTLRVNGFVTSAIPPQIQSTPGVLHTLRADLAELSLQVLYGGELPSPAELTIEGLDGRLTRLAGNLSLLLPPGKYSVLLVAPARELSTSIDLSEDSTLVLALPPAPPQPLPLLQVLAGLEGALLVTLLVVRRRVETRVPPWMLGHPVPPGPGTHKNPPP
jgi:hypothetical protein